jgi:hypothetical protein
MSDNPTTKVFIGSFPAGYTYTAIPERDLAKLQADANMRAEEERLRLRHEALRAELPKTMQRARLTRRFKRAWVALGGH